MTTRRKLIGFGLPIAILAAAAGVFLAPPDRRSVRVRVEVLPDPAGRPARRWTFTGGRRWDSFGQFTRDGEHVVVLEPPGIRDGAAIRFLKEAAGMGANRITYEVTAAGPAAGANAVTWTRALAGNAGGTPRFSSVSMPRPADGRSGEPDRAILGEDAVIPLPARIRLGVFGGLVEVIELR